MSYISAVIHNLANDAVRGVGTRRVFWRLTTAPREPKRVEVIGPGRSGRLKRLGGLLQIARQFLAQDPPKCRFKRLALRADKFP